MRCRTGCRRAGARRRSLVDKEVGDVLLPAVRGVAEAVVEVRISGIAGDVTRSSDGRVRRMGGSDRGASESKHGHD